MKIAVVLGTKPGISPTVVGEQVASGLEKLGHEVVRVPGDGKSPNLSAVNGLPVVNCLEGITADILGNPRFVAPASLITIWVSNWDEYALPDRLRYLSVFMRSRFGAVPVTHISHSPFEDHEIKRTAKDIFAPSVYRELCNQLQMETFGVEQDFIPAATVDPDRMIVPYNRLNQTFKNIRLHSEISRMYLQWANLHGHQPVIDFRHAPGFGPESKSLQFDREVYHWQLQPETREAYKDSIRQYGMFLSTSQSESFGIYYLELLLAGAVGVFLNRPWVDRLLPGYRFATSAGQLASTLAHVREHHDEARSYVVNEVVPMIRERYALDRFLAAIAARLEAITPKEG